jgi:hypothetical protein
MMISLSAAEAVPAYAKPVAKPAASVSMLLDNFVIRVSSLGASS